MLTKQTYIARRELPGATISWVFATGAALFIAAAILGHLDNISYNNDWINALATGFPYGSEQPAIERLVDAAVENCKTTPVAAQFRNCVVYQGNLGINIYFSHPIYALFGKFITSFDSSSPFITLVQRTLLRAALTSLLVLLFLAGVFVRAMDPATRTLVSIAVMAAVVLPGRGWENPTVLDVLNERQPWIASLSIAAAVMATIAFQSTWVASRVNGGRIGLSISRLSNWAGPISDIRMLLGVSAGFVILIGLVSYGGLSHRYFFYGSCLLIVCLLLVIRQHSKIPDSILVVVALLLLLCVPSEVRGHFPHEFNFPRHEVALLFILVAAYAVQNPKGRLTYAMPLLLIFHISVAGVLALAMIVAEGSVCLRRKRLSSLFLASIATLVGAIILMSTLWGKGIQDPASVPIPELIKLVIGSSRLAPMLVGVAALLSLSAMLLREPEGRWDNLARATLLLMLSLGAVQISYLLADTGDPRHKWGAGFYTFANLPEYLVPGAIAAALILVFLTIQCEMASTSSEPIPAVQWISTGFSCTLLLIAMSAMYAPPSVAVFRLAMFQTRQYLWRGENNSHLEQLSKFFDLSDDRYYLARRNPRNHPVMYVSLLKMKIRIHQGKIIDGISVSYIDDDLP